jgi:hypothetical protein
MIMRRLLFGPCLFVLAAAASAFAPAPLPRRQPQPRPHPIVGVWCLTETRGVDAAWSVPVRYTRDGRVTWPVSRDEDGSPNELGEIQVGTYRVEGDRLVVTRRGQTTTATVRFPAPDRLVMSWDGGAKEMTFARAR